MSFDDDLRAEQQRREKVRREQWEREQREQQAARAEQQRLERQALEWTSSLSDRALEDVAGASFGAKWMRRHPPADPRRPPADIHTELAKWAVEQEQKRRRSQEIETSAPKQRAAVAAGIDLSPMEWLVAIAILFALLGGSR